MMLQKKDIELKLQCVLERALMKKKKKWVYSRINQSFINFAHLKELYAGSPTETNNKKISTK